MREIKFRAWLPKGKYGDGDGVMWFFPNADITFDGSLVFWERPEETHYIDETPMRRSNGWILMQYTGLKDKNGKDIYEGDILTDPYGPEGAATGTVENINGDTVIKFIPGTIPEDWAHEYYPVFGGSGEYTVIGNIYENPELLKAI